MNNKKNYQKSPAMIEIFKKYEIQAQIDSINKIPHVRDYILFFITITLFLAFFEFLMIKLFDFNDFQKYIYPIYSFIIGFCLLAMTKFNYKVIIISLSFFGSIKYAFYYLDEISKFYSQSFMFDVYIFSLTFLVVFFIFILQYFIFAVYSLTSMSLNLVYFIFYFLKESIKAWPIPILLIVADYYIFSLLSELILNNLNSTYLIILLFLAAGLLMLMLNMIFMFLYILVSYEHFNKDLEGNFEKIVLNIYSNMFISYSIYKAFKNTNKYLSKSHRNLNFMGVFNFDNLSPMMKKFYLLSILLWGYNIHSYYNYYNSYQYDLSFFEINNGYCSNFNKNILIMKNEKSSDSVFLISDTKPDDFYIYREGKKNKKITRNDKIFNQYSDNDKYYIYEKKCSKIL